MSLAQIAWPDRRFPYLFSQLPTHILCRPLHRILFIHLIHLVLVLNEHFINARKAAKTVGSKKNGFNTFQSVTVIFVARGKYFYWISSLSTIACYVMADSYHVSLRNDATKKKSSPLRPLAKGGSGEIWRPRLLLLISFRICWHSSLDGTTRIKTLSAARLRRINCDKMNRKIEEISSFGNPKPYIAMVSAAHDGEQRERQEIEVE